MTELDPSRQPFLFDHRIDGTPVLPGVMGMEGFAEAAAALVPGFRVVELTTSTCWRRSSSTVTSRGTRDPPRDAHGRRRRDTACRLRADRAPRASRTRPSRRRGTSSAARGSPARRRQRRRRARVRPTEDGVGVGHDAVYGVYFHGPAYQVLERAWQDNGHLVGRFAGELPADHEPASQPTEIAPRLIELCFQTAGVWELATEGRMALPTHVDRVVRYAVGQEAEPAVGRRDSAGRRRRGRRDHRRGRARAGEARGLSHDRAAGRRSTADALAPIRSALNDA